MVCVMRSVEPRSSVPLVNESEKSCKRTYKLLTLAQVQALRGSVLQRLNTDRKLMRVLFQMGQEGSGLDAEDRLKGRKQCILRD